MSKKCSCPLSRPSIKQHLAALKMLFDWLVVGQVIGSNPAQNVRGPKHSQRKGDPNPGNEAAGKLSPAGGYGSLDRKPKGEQMPRKGHTEEQIIRALREAEGGKKAADICREMGVSAQAFYSWKRRFAGLGLTELRELRQLREENRKLKTLVADLTLDKHILREVLSKKI